MNISSSFVRTRPGSRMFWFRIAVPGDPDQVLLNVHRRKPTRWLAVDDSPETWPAWTGAHVVRADHTHGIAEGRVLAELREK